MGVDSEGEVVFVQVPHSPQCGILRAEELAQVFVEHKYQLCHTCNHAVIKSHQTYRGSIAEQSANYLLSQKRYIQSLIFLKKTYIGCNLPKHKRIVSHFHEKRTFTFMSRVGEKIYMKL